VRAVTRDTPCVALLLLLALAVPAAGQQPRRAAATIRATGTFANNGSFTGTLTINRFEQRGEQIVAVGILQGTLSRANRVIGTALATEVVAAVHVSAAGGRLVSSAFVAAPRLAPAGWRVVARSDVRLRRIQAQECTPLQVNLSANNVDLMGVQVALDPIGLTLTGAAGTPLGDLVCAASDLVGNVAGLVNVLNNLLALVTGLLGGSTGGVAAAA
jgi:hypothetical protein